MEKHKAMLEKGPSTKATIRVSTNSRPSCRKSRPVPNVLRKPVEKELDRFLFQSRKVH